MTNYAILIIAEDGDTSVAGPYTSVKAARRAADRVEDVLIAIPGASANVFEMDAPRKLSTWIRDQR